jgi:hypothetical protein
VGSPPLAGGLETPGQVGLVVVEAGIEAESRRDEVALGFASEASVSSLVNMPAATVTAAPAWRN